MARPEKEGADYFPLDVDMDDNIKLVEAEFGIIGFAVVVKLWQKIYKRGYYCEWTDEVALLFAKEIGVGGNVVSEIISASARRGIFDARLLEKYRVLTSSGIQKRYFKIASRRKQLTVEKRYLLVNASYYIDNDSTNVVYVNNNPENVSDNPQSKVNKSKVNENKKESVIGGRRPPSRTKFVPPSLDDIREYCKARGNRVDAQRFYDFYAASEWIDSKGNRVRNWKQKVITWEQGQQAPGTAGTTARQSKPVAAQNYNQRDYTDDELNRLINNVLETEEGENDDG